jgi:ketosteroid isomerase-like protein
LVVFLAGTLLNSQDTDDLNKLVQTEKAFARLAASKSVKQAFLEVFADQGVVFQPAAVNAKKFWGERPESPALLAWSPVWADISSTGNLGYTTGDWDYRPQGIDDQPVAFGQYITLWKKNSDGDFKAVLDIGISHAKPNDVKPNDVKPNDVKPTWASPKTPAENTTPESAIEKPDLSFMTKADYENLLAADVRLYREQSMPMIGKQQAISQIETELANVKSGRVSAASCDGSGDLFYCHGVLELTKNDDSVQKGNLFRIWKRRNDRWFLTLEVFTPLPAGS